MDDNCKCPMAISLTGDGCRYCQPQEYIDRLVEQAEDDQLEIERLEAELEEAKALLQRYADPMDMTEADERIFWGLLGPVDSWHNSGEEK